MHSSISSLVAFSAMDLCKLMRVDLCLDRNYVSMTIVEVRAVIINFDKLFRNRSRTIC